MPLLLSLIVHKIENRLVYICSRNVIFSHIIKITMPPLSIRFFTKCMYNDEIKFINISFSSILTNLCKKNIFDGGPPEGPFSPDGSHIFTNCNSCLSPAPHCTANPMHMISSMAFIRRHRSIEGRIIVKKMVA